MWSGKGKNKKKSGYNKYNIYISELIYFFILPAKANGNKHVFNYVAPLWIIINILFPILCNFGIIQICAFV